MSTVPPRGIYTPVTLFFHEDESIDYTTLREHIARLVAAGITGLVVSGSNGEAAHLSRSERSEVISFIRSALQDSQAPHMPIIAGCGAHSARETIKYCRDAAQAGAQWALVLPPSYWVGAMTKSAIKKFYTAIAENSPIPIVLYNFPAVTNIDLDSDLVLELSQIPSIVGMKFTCCNMGKLQRITTNIKSTDHFISIVGKSEAFLPGLIAGSDGIIGALVNLAPNVHVRMLHAYDSGDLQESKRLQSLLSDADWILAKLGVAGLKAAIDRYYGYGGGRSRLPLPSVSAETWKSVNTTTLDALVKLENSIGQSKL